MLVIDKRVTIIRDDESRPRARLIIATNVTARKQIEEQFLRAQRLESLGMLAAGIAHDLNNAVPDHDGRSAAAGEPEQAGEPNLDNLEKSAERGAALVRQILGVSHGIGGETQGRTVRHHRARSDRIHQPDVSERTCVSNPFTVRRSGPSIALNAYSPSPAQSVRQRTRCDAERAAGESGWRRRVSGAREEEAAAIREARDPVPFWS